MTNYRRDCRDRRGMRWCRHTRHGLTCIEFEDLWQHSGGRCQICGLPEAQEPRGVLFIDHVQAGGRRLVRGLLCNRCNSAFDQRALAGPARDAYLANPWHIKQEQSASALPQRESR